MNKEDFTHLYAEHAQGLYAFLNYRTGNRVLAEDLLADTFERVLRARRGYDPSRGSERTWLYAIALNCVRDVARRAEVEGRALAHLWAADTTVGSEAGFEALERKDVLREALKALSSEEREAVALRFGADLSLADIAAILREPRGTVEGRIYRGLKKLRAALGADRAEPASRFYEAS